MAMISQNAESLRGSTLLSRYFSVPQHAVSFRVTQCSLTRGRRERWTVCLFSHVYGECGDDFLWLFLFIFYNIILPEIYIKSSVIFP